MSMHPAPADPTLSLDPATLAVAVQPGDGNTSVAFEFVQAAVDAVAQGRVTIAGLSGPTVAARFYSMAGTALYEAWQLTDPKAHSSLANDCCSTLKLRHLERKVQRIQGHLHPCQQQQFITNLIAATASRVLSAAAPEAASLFAEASQQSVVSLGRRLDCEVQQISRSLSREIGKVFSSDGALAGATAPYSPVNSDPENVIVLDRWTPEYRMGDDPASGLQTYLTPGWGDVRAFVDSDRLDTFVSTTKAPEPFLLDPGATADLQARTITTSDGQVVPISREAVGTLINPGFISQAEGVIDISAGLTEEGKFVAEFWEDGGGTPFPPGTWMIFGQYAAEKESLSLGDEVKLYFTLGHAMQSAAVATWQQKLDTNYARPERVIRELSELGLLGDEDDVDPVTGISRFEAYSRETYQTEMIDGTSWETYQNPAGGYNPPFAEYPSGHSTFSAAGGKVLDLFTGDDFGGAVTGRGVFEPSTENEVVTLEWDTWQQAVEEAGFSRLYGGIHFDDGNLEGQKLGALIGEATFATATQLWA